MPTSGEPPPELVTRFDELAALAAGADRREIFGYPSCVIHGNMFMGLYEDSLILRLAEPDAELAVLDRQIAEAQASYVTLSHGGLPGALVSICSRWCRQEK